MTKTAMITGATSGFGAATVRRFAKAGWRVVATGRRADRLQALVGSSAPRRPSLCLFDVRDANATGRRAGRSAASIQRCGPAD